MKFVSEITKLIFCLQEAPCFGRDVHMPLTVLR